MFKGQWDYVLIPDCRFPIEVDYLREIGLETLHLRVVRHGFVGPLTAQQQIHPSETALDDAIPDACIDNDGSLDDLQQAVIQWAAGAFKL